MIELLNIDCLQYMATLPDKAFDLAIVDPPYGIGVFTCSAHTDNNGKRIQNHKQYTDDYLWNKEIPEKQYFSELIRVSKERIIWGANYYNCFENGKGALVWYKGNMTQTISHCEIASLSFQTRVSYVQINWQAGFFREMKEGKAIHPCQKPVALYDWLLRNYAKPNQRILDTHLGSGSSAIAAHYFGCDFVGCEIDTEYFNAAKARFDRETRQVALF
jgi:site-specific DNA-methyltransferase (adenine-specific)